MTQSTAEDQDAIALIREGEALAHASMAYAQKVMARYSDEQPERLVTSIGACHLMDGFSRLTLAVAGGWRE